MKKNFEILVWVILSIVLFGFIFPILDHELNGHPEWRNGVTLIALFVRVILITLLYSLVRFLFREKK